MSLIGMIAEFRQLCDDVLEPMPTHSSFTLDGDFKFSIEEKWVGIDIICILMDNHEVNFDRDQVEKLGKSSQLIIIVLYV